MNTMLKTLFYDNPGLAEEIAAFLAQDPEYVQAEREFYETAYKIAPIIGDNLYHTLEERLGTYIACMADTYYLFGLGLRQEVLRAIRS